MYFQIRACTPKVLSQSTACTQVLSKRPCVQQVLSKCSVCTGSASKLRWCTASCPNMTEHSVYNIENVLRHRKSTATHNIGDRPVQPSPKKHKTHGRRLSLVCTDAPDVQLNRKTVFSTWDSYEFIGAFVPA